MTPMWMSMPRSQLLGVTFGGLLITTIMVFVLAWTVFSSIFEASQESPDIPAREVAGKPG